MMQRMGMYSLVSRGINRGSSQLIQQQYQQQSNLIKHQFHTACGSTPLTAAAAATASVVVSSGGSSVGGAVATAIDNDDIQRRFRSNRSRRGLYDGKDIRTGE